MTEPQKKDALLGAYRVLDLTDEKGYLCGKILGDLGSDVVKLEKPGGDPGRNRGPFYKDMVHPEKSLFWMFGNTSKRGITLDIETADGKEIFKSLVKTADFLVESFCPGYMDNLGLGYSALSKINPRLIMTSVTPFGPIGPHSDFQVTDMVVWAMGGLMYLTGDADRAPVRIGTPQAYFFGGLHAALGTLVAHYYRETTGDGQYVDVSAQEGCMLTLANATEVWYLLQMNMARAGGYQIYGRPEPHGPMKLRMIWPCKDGFVCLFLMGGAHGGVTKSSVKLTEWALNEGMAQELKSFDWSNLDASTVSQEEVDFYSDAIGRFLLTKTKKELHEGAVARGIILVPVNDTRDLLESPQLAARDFWEKVEHPELKDTLIYPGAPGKLDDAPWRIWRRAPLIGEHNEEIYGGELGISKEKLAMLKHARVI